MFEKRLSYQNPASSKTNKKQPGKKGLRGQSRQIKKKEAYKIICLVCIFTRRILS
jgi:hypothetical protein